MSRCEKNMSLLIQIAALGAIVVLGFCVAPGLAATIPRSSDIEASLAAIWSLMGPSDAATAFGLALLTFAVVDLERVLEITEFAVGLAVIAQRRAAGVDRLIEHRVDRRDQPSGVIGRLSLFCRECRC